MAKDRPVFKPDEDIENADWPKRTRDSVEAITGRKRIFQKPPKDNIKPLDKEIN